MSKKLPVTEELDFAYLLSLLPALHSIDSFSWLPELFSIIGHEKLILLCRYVGGETITIPTIEQLNEGIDALQRFYDVYISKKNTYDQIPTNRIKLVNQIYEIYSTEYDS